MEPNQNNNNNNIALANEGLPIAIIIAAFYYKYRDNIQEKLHDPFFMFFLISGIVLLVFIYYSVGHQVEKYMNKIKMLRSGINLDEKQKSLSFPFIPFDLQKALNDFYKDGKNRDRTFLGLNAEKQNRETVNIPDIQRTQHLQVLGMIGTGKTSSAFLPLIYQDVLKGRPVIIIDAKGEKSSINQIYGMLHSMGRADDFLLLSLAYKESSCTYNPLYVGECDPQVIIDSFFNNFKDENSFYHQSAKTIFSHTFFILHSLSRPFAVMDVYAYINNDDCKKEIDALVKASGNQEGLLNLKLFDEQITSLNQQFKSWKSIVSGFNNYLKDYKEAILNEADSDIVFTDVIRHGKVVYLQLPTNAYPIQAPGIARIVQSNLRYISSLIQIGQLPKDVLISINIDEYGSFAEESAIEVHNKARSSHMMITIAHQSINDLSRVSDSFRKLMDEHTLNKIYFKDNDPIHCEWLAKSLGTQKKEEKTYRTTAGKFGNQIYTGESSNKMVNEFNFSPDKIKNLHKYGQGYYIYKGDNTQVCVNFGYLPDLPEMPYARKVKKNKNEGLKLFEKYYVNNRESTNQNKTKGQSEYKPEDKADLGGVSKK
jgi:hypothetical protein